MSWKVWIEIALLCSAVFCTLIYLWIKARHVLTIMELRSNAYTEAPIWLKVLWIGITLVLFVLSLEGC
jgi:hypothetical protein